jgi:hypothetical protein
MRGLPRPAAFCLSCAATACCAAPWMMALERDAADCARP